MTDEVQEVAPRIVEGVFTASNSSTLGVGGGKSPLSKLIEKAMAQAVDDAYSHGITEPEKVRGLMLEARAEVKAKYQQAVTEALGNLTG